MVNLSKLIKRKYNKWRKVWDRVGMTTKAFLIVVVVQFFILETLAIINLIQAAQAYDGSKEAGP